MKNTVLKCGDDTTRQLLGNFQQRDLQENIFVKTDQQSIIARTENQLVKESVNLSESIYYSPTNFPLISRNDIRKGTAWEDWSYPNFNTSFLYRDNKIVVENIKRNKISISQYTDKIKVILDKNILDIFKKNKNLRLFLCYSKGIDSILILSYLIKNKLQDKVTLINFSNALTNNKNKNFVFEKTLGFNVENTYVNLDSLISACNTIKRYVPICYSTYSLLNLHKDSSFIFGFHGNQSLLHKEIFLEQINKDVTNNGYCSSLNNWKKTQTPTPLEEHCLLIKPWNSLNDINGCKIYDPLGNQEIFEMVRSIEWSNVDPHIVSDAKVARQIIKDNVGDMLDSIITEEDITESDNIIGDLEIPMEQLNEEIFDIQEEIFVNKQGHSWLLSEYGRAKEKNCIKLNTLLSFITMNNYYKAK